MIKFEISNPSTSNRVFGKINNNQNEVLTMTEVEADDPSSMLTIDCDGRLVTPITSVNQLGKQVLKAAADGDVEETRALLCRGALFTTDWLGTSPLHMAARNNHPDVCEVLLKAGISRDARTKVDKTALHLAATAGHVAVVELLLDYGCDPDSRDMLGMTPLHWAIQNGHTEVATILVKSFAQIDAFNKFELTPMAIAAQMNRPDLVDILNMDTGELTGAITKNLVNDFGNEISESNSNSPIPLETILLEDPEPLVSEQIIKQQNHFDVSMKILQEHGITMLQNEDDHILSAAMESGHSVVLTDVGKEVLDSLRQEERETEQKLYNCTKLNGNGMGEVKNVLKQINGRVITKPTNKIIANKQCKVISVSKGNHVYKLPTKSPTDMETVMKELIEARKTIEEYKVKLFKKEQEVERYKQQLTLLMDQR